MLFIVLLAFPAFPVSASRPNIVVILADDLGWSDLGAYGGEIKTPNLDALARDGLRYTQFYNTGRCWPTRASILTGYYAQQVRMDPPSGLLPTWSRIVARPLERLGYRTYHSGKWHVSGAPRPVADGGFGHSYHVVTQDRFFSPRKTTLDDRSLPRPEPGSGYYTTTAIADYAIKFLNEHEQQHADKPFFLYVAFTAPHFPLHAIQKDIDHYRETYEIGWDAVRAQRHARLEALGLYEGPLPPLEPNYKPAWNLPPGKLEQIFGPGTVATAVPWNTLSPEQKAFQARKMAIHAAMVDRMDREIGRLIETLKKMGAFENTVILFLSDNGASAEQIVRGDGHDGKAPAGSASTYLSIGPGWSSAANTPLRLHKSWVHEGGVATPLIVHWPEGIRARGALRHALGHAVDIPVTLLDLAGGHISDLPARKAAPRPPGKSLVPTFNAPQAPLHQFVFFSHTGNRALRQGKWKLVRSKGMQSWALYDMSADRAEQHDLAVRYPDRVAKMARMWGKLDAQFKQDAEGTQKSSRRPN